VILVKNVKAIILALFFLCAVISTSFAEWQSPGQPKAYKNLQLTGQVKALDKKAMVITVAKKIRQKEIEVVATVNDNTKIMMSEKNMKFDDIKVGDKVVMEYSEVDGKNIAKNILIKPAEPEKKTGTEKQTEQKAK